MYTDTQIEGLKTTLVILYVGRQPCTNLVQGLLVICNARSDHDILDLL